MSRRKALSHETLEERSLHLSNELLQLPIWHFSYYHLFLSIPDKKELNTEYILNILSGKDKYIVLPRCNFEDNSLSHFLLTDATRLVVNNWGVPEPDGGIAVELEKIDIVFIPLLAFDREGHRVGYGKGFYDRFLSTCPKHTLKIGLSLFEPVKRISDIAKHDIPLDYCVTPESTYSF